VTTPSKPMKPPCWPNSKDWLDGKTEIEEGLLTGLKAEWDADIFDPDDPNKRDTIIEADDKFKVRFRVQLQGKLWSAMTGTWYFDLGFAPIGNPTPRGSFDLSQVIPNPAQLSVAGWNGCKDQCIEVELTLAATDIPANSPSTVYDVVGKFALESCGQLVLVGHESLPDYQFTR
jgi:hypothetical protein